MVIMMTAVLSLPSSLCWRLSRFRKRTLTKKLFDVNKSGRGLGIFLFWFDDAFNAS